MIQFLGVALYFPPVGHRGVYPIANCFGDRLLRIRFENLSEECTEFLKVDLSIDVHKARIAIIGEHNEDAVHDARFSP